MSLPRLLVVLLTFSSLKIALAEDLRIQPQKPPSFTTPNASNTITSEQKDYVYAVTPDLLHNRRDGIIHSDATCFTMRTYVADRNFDKEFVLKPGTPEGVSFNPQARTGSQADSPLTGNYTTCQPSSQFAVKEAIQPVGSANDGK